MRELLIEVMIKELHAQMERPHPHELNWLDTTNGPERCIIDGMVDLPQLAFAIITALWEPSDAMQLAGVRQWLGADLESTAKADGEWPVYMVKTWQAMLRAAMDDIVPGSGGQLA